MDFGPEALIAVAHGRALRLLSRWLRRPFNGLGDATRNARKQGLVTNASARRLVYIDNAFAITRHITPEKVEAWLEDLGRECASRSWSEVAPEHAHWEDRSDDSLASFLVPPGKAHEPDAGAGRCMKGVAKIDRELHCSPFWGSIHAQHSLALAGARQARAVACCDHAVGGLPELDKVFFDIACDSAEMSTQTDNGLVAGHTRLPSGGPCSTHPAAATGGPDHHPPSTAATTKQQQQQANRLVLSHDAKDVQGTPAKSGDAPTAAPGRFALTPLSDNSAASAPPTATPTWATAALISSTQEVDTTSLSGFIWWLEHNRADLQALGHDKAPELANALRLHNTPAHAQSEKPPTQASGADTLPYADHLHDDDTAQGTSARAQSEKPPLPTSGADTLPLTSGAAALPVSSFSGADTLPHADHLNDDDTARDASARAQSEEPP